MENTRVVKVAGAKVTAIDKLKMRHRNQQRQIIRIVSAAGAEFNTAQEYALLVVRTVIVDGDLWKPPSADAPPNELLAGYEYMLDNLTGDLVDEWLTAMAVQHIDPETSPLPLAEDADPNE